MARYSGIETEDAKGAMTKKPPIKENHTQKKVHRPESKRPFVST